MKKLYIIKEGYFKTNWIVKTNKAFTSRQDIHKFMEEKNGFKCYRSDDEFSTKGTRFKNKEKSFGYDIVPITIYEAPKVQISE